MNNINQQLGSKFSITKILSFLAILTFALTIGMSLSVKNAQAENFFDILVSEPRCLVDHAYCDDDSSSGSTSKAITGYCYTNVTSANVNTTVTWAAEVSGGNGTYTYSWSGTDGLTGCSSAGFCSSASKSYANPGIKTASVTIHSGSKTKVINCNGSVNILAVQQNLTGSCSVNTTSIPVNGSVTWSANVSGGTGSYTYSWSGTDGLSGYSSSVSKSYPYSGSKTASVTVTSGSNTQTFYCNNSVVVQEVQNPTLTGSCSVNTTSVPVNGSVTWSANISGGNGYYTYSWSGTDSLSGYSSSVSKSYYNTGTKTGSVTVTSGSQSQTFYCNNSVVVQEIQNPTLTGSCSMNTTSIPVNGSVTWSANVSGGTGTYSYVWSGTDSLVGSSASVSKTYYNTGTKTGSVTVTSGTQSQTFSCNNSVIVQENQQTLTGSCSVNTTSIPVNGSVTWSANVSGGTGSYTYSWSGTDGLSGYSSSVSKSYPYSGSKTASVTVTSGSNTQTFYCNNSVVVQENQNQNLTGSCYANTTSVSVNNSVTWNANVSGGNGSYSYSWSGTDGVYGYSSSVSKYYSYSGNKTASVTVTSGGTSQTFYCNNSVNVNDNNNNNNYNLAVTCRPSITYTTTGSSVVWNAYANGGSGYYTYTWSGTDNLWDTGSSAVKSYWNTGYKTASVTVYSNGQTITTGCDGGVNVTDGGYNYNYNSNLAVSCTANIISGLSGNTVTWSAVPTGGNGYYTYSWSGTDSLSGYSAAISKTYWVAGTKTASVVVTSGGQSITRQCANTVAISLRPITVTPDPIIKTVYVQTQVKTANELIVTCSPNTTLANANDTIVWISNVSGGTGLYTYKWEGSDNLTGDVNYIAKTYFNNGMKVGVLTVKSGNQTVNKVCGNVQVGDQDGSTLGAMAIFGGWTGLFLILLLICTIIFLGILLYFLNIRDRERDRIIIDRNQVR